MKRTDRKTKQQILTTRYREVVPTVKGGITAILLRPEVVEAWSWILLRASLDIAEKMPNRILESGSEDSEIAGLIGRIGARLALPEAFEASVFTPVPKVEFWKSHVTGESLPNPWTVGNLTDQLFVEQQLGKDFAAELEIAAEGGRSYQQEFERRATAQLAQVIKNFPADGFNPHVQAFDIADLSPAAIEWKHKAMQEIQRLQRENPPLNEWLEKVAQPLYANPYESIGSNRTKQVMIENADGDFARLLERTASFRRLQFADEKEARDRLSAEIDAEAASADAKDNRAARRARYGG